MGTVEGIARRAQPKAPMEELAETALTPEQGVAGDSRGWPGQRQVVVLAAEAWAAALAELDGAPAPWTLRRANFLVRGIALPRRAGVRLRLGAGVLETTGECEPCRRMDQQLLGLRAALAPDWRGGITCRVLEGAIVRVGDFVEIVHR